jgi:hypothetical protein
MPGPSIISSAMAIAASIVNLGIPLVVIEATSLPLTRILIFWPGLDRSDGGALRR